MDLQTLLTSRPTSIVVLLAGDVAALCTPDRVYPAQIIDRMPARHPDRALVDIKCLYAGAILHGDLEGPYDDDEADQLARQIRAADDLDAF